MTHASLFSGIGGFDLAAAWAGWTNVFNCEIDPFCRRVLKYHFPESEQYEDIRTTDFTVWRDRVDVLTGGFPCQPFSLAGKRKGTADDRYLWPAMLGVVRTVRPRWVVGENVLGIVNWSQEWSSSRCALIWKRQDMRCKRTLYQLRASVLPICDTEHGLLPTVVTQGLKVHGKSGSEPLSPAMLPTPVASDCGSGRVNRSLSKGASERPTLALAARMGLLSMPTACDAKNNSFPLSHAKRKSGAVHDVMISHPSRTGKGSRLSPRYVAQMMGFPPDWTELPFRHGAASRSKPTATP